jgi:hypothetical protein
MAIFVKKVVWVPVPTFTRDHHVIMADLLDLRDLGIPAILEM